jgi:hypothetical protein
MTADHLLTIPSNFVTARQFLPELHLRACSLETEIALSPIVHPRTKSLPRFHMRFAIGGLPGVSTRDAQRMAGACLPAMKSRRRTSND